MWGLCVTSKKALLLWKRGLELSSCSLLVESHARATSGLWIPESWYDLSVTFSINLFQVPLCLMSFSLLPFPIEFSYSICFLMLVGSKLMS